MLKRQIESRTSSDLANKFVQMDGRTGTGRDVKEANTD